MRVSLRVKKLAYILATLACVLAAVAVVGWGVRPSELATTRSTQILPATSSAPSQSPRADKPEPNREDFAKLWDHPLRRVLYDPPPPPPVVKQLPPLRVELLGTIIEPDNSMAMIRSEQGTVEYKRVGDALGPADSLASVVEIGPDKIVVERAAERITLGVQNQSRR